jgi:hypothetical protein
VINGNEIDIGQLEVFLELSALSWPTIKIKNFLKNILDTRSCSWASNRSHFPNLAGISRALTVSAKNSNLQVGCRVVYLHPSKVLYLETLAEWLP